MSQQDHLFAPKEQTYYTHIPGQRPPSASPPEYVRPAFAAGLACFDNKKVDLYLDGELQDRARAKFS